MDNSIEAQEKNLQIKHTWDWERFKPGPVEELIAKGGEPALGYLSWIKMSHSEEDVDHLIEGLRLRKVQHLRTGVSWAEWAFPEGREWIRTYLKKLEAARIVILPCFSFTPEELAVTSEFEGSRVNHPPRDVGLYALFVSEVLREFGHLFEMVELWNEWNLNTDWRPELDPQYETFTLMVAGAGRVAHQHGKRTLLGGPSKINEETLLDFATLSERGLHKYIDMLGFHNLRGTWTDSTPPPPLGVQADLIRRAWGKDVPVWLTEYGFSTGDPMQEYEPEYLEKLQVSLFAHTVYALLSGDLERAYWYTFRDEVHESLRQATTGKDDILQYYYGDTREDGSRKLLGKILLKSGPTGVLRYAAKANLMRLVDEASIKRTMPPT